MAVVLSADLKLVAQETEDSQSDVVGELLVQHMLRDLRTLKATSTVPVTKVYSAQVTLSAGALSIDLTSLTGAIGQAIDLTDLKVQAIGFKPLAANTDTMTIAPHATNGYDLFGSSGQAEIAAGGSLFAVLAEGAPDVGSSAKVIELTSNDADAKADILIVAG